MFYDVINSMPRLKQIKGILKSILGHIRQQQSAKPFGSFYTILVRESKEREREKARRKAKFLRIFKSFQRRLR